MPNYTTQDLYRELYFKSMEQKEHLLARLQINFAFLIAIISLVAYMLRNLILEPVSPLIIFFAVILISFVMLFGIAFYHFTRGMWGNEYFEVNKPQDMDSHMETLESYAKELNDYIANNPEDETVDKNYSVKTRMEEIIHSQFGKCATHNMITNQDRAFRIHCSIEWILYSLIPLLVLALTFIFGGIAKP